MNDPRGYTTEQAAEILGCKVAFLTNGAQRREIPYRFYGSVRIFTTEDLNDIANQFRVTPQAVSAPAEEERPRIGKRAERRNAA